MSRGIPTRTARISSELYHEIMAMRDRAKKVEGITYTFPQMTQLIARLLRKR